MNRPLQDHVPSAIGRHHVNKRMTFRRGVLKMAHVQINPSGIAQESPIPRRLVMPAVMEIEHTLPLNPEHMVADLMREPGRRMVRAVLMDEESVLGFQSENAVQHD